MSELLTPTSSPQYILLFVLFVWCEDPLDWTSVHVQKWLLWTEHIYRLPQVCRMFQELTGKDLCSMSEEDFRQRSLQCGDMLHAHLDIWKSGTTTATAFSCCPVSRARMVDLEEMYYTTRCERDEPFQALSKTGVISWVRVRFNPTL